MVLLIIVTNEPIEYSSRKTHNVECKITIVIIIWGPCQPAAGYRPPLKHAMQLLSDGTILATAQKKYNKDLIPGIAYPYFCLESREYYKPHLQHSVVS